jgi:hypothetical protein
MIAFFLVILVHQAASLVKRLSSERLGRIPFGAYWVPFEFVVGDVTFSCHRFIADFLSPKIGEMHSIDPNCSSYNVTLPDPHGFFPSVLGLALGKAVDINETNCDFISEVAQELENIELYLLAEEQLRECPGGRVVPRFRARKRLGLDCEKEAETVASQFFSIASEVMDLLNASEMSEILAHPALKIESEDQLYSLIAARFDRHPDFFKLLEYVRFEFLSVDTISRFVQTSHQYIPLIGESLWARIGQRLVLPVEANHPQPADPRYATAAVNSVPKPQPSHGIISALTAKYGGNLHVLGIVEVTASTAAPYGFLPHYVLDIERDSAFVSLNAPQQWLRIDFRSRRVWISAYRIRSFFNGTENSCNLRSWILEQSNDAQAWAMLDEQQDNNDLNGRNLSATFSVRKRDPARYVQLRQTGPDHAGSYFILISSIEFFGDVIGL